MTIAGLSLPGPAGPVRPWRFLKLTGCLIVLYMLGYAASISFSDLLPTADHWHWWVPFWLPTGMALAVALRFGPSALPGIFLGSLLCNLYIGLSLPVAGLISIVNASQIAIATAIIRRHAPLDELFSRTRHVGHFLMVTAAVTFLYAGPLGTLFLRMGGGANESLLIDIFRWSLGDVTSILIVTPLLHMALTARDARGPVCDLEAALLLVLGTIAAASLFGDILLPPQFQRLPLEFLLFPFIVLTALRHTALISSLMVLALVLVATIATASGHGPFNAATSSRGALLLLQALITAMSMTGMLLCAASQERRDSQQRLKETLSGLDNLVRARTVALNTANRQLGLEAARHAWTARINQGRSRLMESLTRGEELPALLSGLQAEILRLLPQWDARIALGPLGDEDSPDMPPSGMIVHHTPVRGSAGEMLARIIVSTSSGERLTREQRTFLEETAQLARVIVEHRQNQQALQRLARHDPLTGALNRRAFTEALEAMIAAHPGTAVVYMDLDGFKEINDSRGHAQGDRLLVDAVRCFEKLIGPDAALGRIDGDEFVIALPCGGRRELAGLLAGRLVDICATLGGHCDLSSRVTASIGVALHGLDAFEPEALLIAADTAMYAAKRAGGAGYCFAGRSLNGAEALAG